MSQQSAVDEQLRALLERHEREKRELIENLSRAPPHTSQATPILDGIHNSSRTSAPSRPVVITDVHTSTTVPRSAGNDLRTPPTKQLQQDQSRPMKRSKTTHAAGSSAAAPMTRSRSSVSRWPEPNPNPFVSKGQNPIAPPAMHSLPTAGLSSFGGYGYQSEPQFPTNTFTSDRPLTTALSQHGDLGREMGIDEFLLMHDDDLFPTTSPISIPPSTLLSPAEQYPTSSFPSACGSLTSGPTLDTAPMSRRNSSLNDGASISGQFNEMVRIQSQQSAHSFRPNPAVAHPPLLGKRPSEGSGLVTLRGDSFTYAYPSSAPTHSSLSQHQHPMEPSLSQSSIQSTSSAGLSPQDLSGPLLAQHLAMERSVSKDSVKSNSSLKLRAKEALARQNYAAKSRHLQPKPAAGAIKPDVPSPVGSGKDGKAVITKTKYERPKHPKVMCNQCKDHPEGFRGEHELRRHTEAKHKSMVKKWICRDPDLYGIPHAETAVKALKDCKQCSQNKQYGAYYNAAAHLRRTHFNVKPRKGAGSKTGQFNVEEEKEKRGGKGGGDWPSMSELKLWMVEVTVPMDQPGALVPDGTESVGAVDPEDLETEVLDPQYSSQLGLPMAMGSDGFGMSTFAGVGGGFSQTIDMTSASFHGDLDSQLSEMYRLHASAFPSSSLPAVPISSAAFDYRSTDLSTQQSMAASLMSLDSHGYTSPVSSTATITQTGVYMDQILPHATAPAPRDDLGEMPFELTFATTGQ